MKGFRHFETRHCVTGSMRHIYAFHGHDLSEELLLGLGEGVGFAYFRFKGQLPFLGGRAQPKPSMEEIAALRTGVAVTALTSSNDAAAEKALLQRLDRGDPCMVQVDMGYLSYFDFGGSEYHFGGHVVVVCGHEPSSGMVLVADRDRELHPVSLAELAAARGSRHRPFPPGKRWWDFDFSGFRQPRAVEVLQAVQRQAVLMLNPPIANIGVKGIRKAAAEIARWDALLEPGELRGALFNVWIFVNETGGTGGGAFRRMFSSFLAQAANIACRPELANASADFRSISVAWDEVAVMARKASGERSPVKMASHLHAVSAALLGIADMEEAGWRDLARIAD